MIPLVRAGLGVAAVAGSALHAAAPEFWIKADAITGLADGASISTVTDQSGNGYTATAGGTAPTYKVNISPSGLPVMRFSGSAQQLNSSAPAWGTQTIFAVIKINSVAAGQYGAIRGASGNNGLEFRQENGPDLGLVKQQTVGIGASSSHPLSVGTFYVVAARVTDGASYEIFVNGTSVVSASTSTTTGPGHTTSVGKNNSGGGDDFNGDIGELASWSRTLTNTEVSNITTELRSKWGI